jgi:translation elongation factor EF-Tu-like GTPase
MKKENGIPVTYTIGCIDHSRTTLTDAITTVIASSTLEVTQTQKSIDEIMEENKTYSITNQSESLPKMISPDGQYNRRERRKQMRKQYKS